MRANYSMPLRFTSKAVRDGGLAGLIISYQFAVKKYLLDRLRRRRWVEPVSLLDDPGDGERVVYLSVLLEGQLEEREVVLVLRDVHSYE